MATEMWAELKPEDCPLFCEWEEDFEGNWESSCQGIFILNEGTPSENKFRFCPFCGLGIKEVLFNDLEDAGRPAAGTDDRGLIAAGGKI